MRHLLLFLLCSTIVFAQDSVVFDEIEFHFSKASLPTVTDLKGYSSGRCATYEAPNTLMPSVLLTKKIADESMFPPVRQSFSYYSEEGKADRFDQFTSTQINQHPKIAQWMKEEQWQKIQEKDGSLVTFYSPGGIPRLSRALRRFEGTNASYLLMKVSRITATQEVPIRYCYFHRPLKETTGPSEEPISQEYLVGQTVGSTTGFFSIPNTTPERRVRKIRIVNQGAKVTLQEFQVFFTPNQVTAPISIVLEANSSTLVKVGELKEFELRKLQFYLQGVTKGLQVFALTDSVWK